MEVRSRDAEKEVPLQHGECEGDLGLVSPFQSLWVFLFSNAGPGSLSSRVMFIVIVLSEEETVLCRAVCLCVFWCVSVRAI